MIIKYNKPFEYLGTPALYALTKAENHIQSIVISETPNNDSKYQLLILGADLNPYGARVEILDTDKSELYRKRDYIVKYLGIDLANPTSTQSIVDLTGPAPTESDNGEV